MRLAVMGILLAGAGVICGALLTVTITGAGQSDPARGVVCRPSAPALLVTQSPQPTLLVFGNSLIFDNDWRVQGYQPVNCAQQGLTARAAQSLLPSLPAVAPDALLLGFGSVEAIRAVLTDRAVDPVDFAQAMTEILAALQSRWPETEVVLSSVPAWGPDAQFPTMVVQRDARALNTVLRDLAQADPKVHLLDLQALPSMDPADRAAGSYDGRHLSPGIYREWEESLHRLLNRLRISEG